MLAVGQKVPLVNILLELEGTTPQVEAEVYPCIPVHPRQDKGKKPMIAAGPLGKSQDLKALLDPILAVLVGLSDSLLIILDKLMQRDKELISLPMIMLVTMPHSLAIEYSPDTSFLQAPFLPCTVPESIGTPQT